MELEPFFDADLNLEEERMLDGVYRRYKQVLQAKGVLRFCPTPYCTMGYTVGEGNGDPFDCPSCHKVICTRCVIPYHKGKACQFHPSSQIDQGFSVEGFNMSSNKSKQEHDAVLYHANRYIRRKREAAKVLKNRYSALKEKLDTYVAAEEYGIAREHMIMTSLRSSVIQKSPKNEDCSPNDCLSADPKNLMVCSKCSSPIKKSERCNNVTCELCHSDLCLECGVNFLANIHFRKYFPNLGN